MARRHSPRRPRRRHARPCRSPATRPDRPSPCRRRWRQREARRADRHPRHQRRFQLEVVAAFLRRRFRLAQGDERHRAGLSGSTCGVCWLSTMHARPGAMKPSSSNSLTSPSPSLSARPSSARANAQLSAPRFLPSIVTSGVSLSSATAPTKVTFSKIDSRSSCANFSGGSRRQLVAGDRRRSGHLAEVSLPAPTRSAPCRRSDRNRRRRSPSPFCRRPPSSTRTLRHRECARLVPGPSAAKPPSRKFSFMPSASS